MRGTEKSLSDFLRYFGILENKNKNKRVHRKIQGKITGNIRTRIVTKKLQILDKWELQGNKRNGRNGVMCTGGVVMLRHPPTATQNKYLFMVL